MYSSDNALIVALNNNDPKAFKELYEKYWELLFRHAYFRIGTVSESEDIVQDLFLEIWNNRKKIRIQKDLKIYLLTAIKYKVYRSIDKSRWTSELTGLEENPDYNEQEILEFEELYLKLEVTIEKLPPKQRIVFKLSRQEKLSTQEIADKLKIAHQTVHNRIHQSLVFLRTELKNYTLFLLIFLIP